MPEFFENNEMEERVILVGVSSQDGDDTEDSLDELEELVKTAGAVTVGRVIQNRQTIHPGLYIGSGKVEELLDEIAWTNATGIVCDDELSPAQLRNLSDALNVKVMDRTLIILDIFAARASTSEGKIQVELAQLRYRMSRLSGIGKSMSRLGGGIGTRGPGEKKLEVDRRLIASRISQLKRELEEVKRHREVNRVARQRNHVPVAAIVGYTNAGKSTLLKAIAGIFSPDEGEIDLHGHSISLLSIGVGFQNKLSGRENIFLSGMLLGFERPQIEEKLDEIIEFSELGDFIDRPVKTYSSGMYSKLAFSITAILETEIMLIDEVLSVGDAKFKKKSYEKMRSLIMNKDRTVVIVSHSSDTLRKLCDNILWLHDGEVKMQGTTEEVLPLYEEFMS